MKKPLLVMFSGKGGSGKTTMARTIAGEFHMPYLDYDTLVQPFLGAIESAYGLGDGDRYAFYRVWREPCYQTLLAPTLENLGLGNDMVVSAPFSSEVRNRDFPARLQELSPRPFTMLLCHMAPPDDQHFQMLEERNSRRDEDFLHDKNRFLQVYRTERPAWDDSLILILDSGNFDRNKHIIEERILSLRRNSV